MNPSDKVPVPVRVPYETLLMLRKIAKDEDRSVSNLVRIAIKEYLERKNQDKD